MGTRDVRTSLESDHVVKVEDHSVKYPGKR